MQTLTVISQDREEIIDITNQIRIATARNNYHDGALLIYCPHTTCGLTINESADPAIKHDLMRFFREIAPQRHDWRHVEGNTDAHIRCSLLGVSPIVPVVNGELRLGTWQAIYLYEGDGPRTRSVWLQFLRA